MLGLGTVTAMLLWMTTLFLLSVIAFYLVRLDKRQKMHSDFIEGTWERRGVSPEGDAWVFRYAFFGNQFNMTGEPNFQTKGNYKVNKEVENLLVLDLFNISGDGETNPYHLAVGIDKKEDKIIINERAFFRVGG